MAEALSDTARQDNMVSDGLAAWLASRYPDRPGLRVTHLSQNPNNGFSNDSIFLDLADQGAISRLVVRIPPRGQGMMADFDLSRQAAIQCVLANAGLPTVKPIAFEGDKQWIGAPFMVMPMIAGQVPPDEPHYSRAGWLFDLPAARQQSLYENALYTMARIHRTDWKIAAFLARPGGIGLRAEFEWWVEYLDWAAAGQMPDIVARTLQWLRDFMPGMEPAPSILWGDARLGNIIFGAEQEPAAVLDWENATLGPAEIDIGYFLAYERRNRARLGNEGQRELPGFPTRDETIAFYEAQLGRPLEHLGWYEVFGILRIAGFMLRVQHLMRLQGLHDHFVMKRPLIQPWVVELMAATEPRM